MYNKEEKSVEKQTKAEDLLLSVRAHSLMPILHLKNKINNLIFLFFLKNIFQQNNGAIKTLHKLHISKGQLLKGIKWYLSVA